MSDVAISVENLSKAYFIGHNAVRSGNYTSLRDEIVYNARNLARKTRDMVGGREIVQGDEVEEFWALKDVSFQINHGERVGIIGRNGAGKSTLLKILSRITEPTTGRIKIAGRVASLLEVGTGFHPELTGRENIFLNGAVLGMTRKEIQNKFDQIVDFAEVEKFLDTPVKRYSSGMYVRLAFSIAAHLEPEILIVDEVLAVGDAQFQKKCLGKMDQASKEGRTVLFVSHNVEAIERMCGRIVWLQAGKLVEDNSHVQEVMSKYLYDSKETNLIPAWYKDISAISNHYFDLISLKLIDLSGQTAPSIFSRDMNINLQIEAQISQFDAGLNVGYIIYSDEGRVVYESCCTDTSEKDWPKLSVGHNLLITTLPKKLLNEGSYSIEVMASLHNRQWLIEPGKSSNRIGFKVAGGLSDSPIWLTKRRGVIAPIIPWFRK
jgi:lipopolysaccharide transport system ATP-binding protein